MFKSNKKVKEDSSMMMGNQFLEDDDDLDADLIGKSFSQPIQNTMQGNVPNARPQQVQQVQQPVQQNQPIQMQQVQPQQYQPQQVQYVPQQVQPVQMQQPIQQPIQQQMPQMPQRQALIVGIELTENGEYVHKVVTNYQLSIGYCQLVQ